MIHMPRKITETDETTQMNEQAETIKTDPEEMNPMKIRLLHIPQFDHEVIPQDEEAVEKARFSIPRRLSATREIT